MSFFFCPLSLSITQVIWPNSRTDNLLSNVSVDAATDALMQEILRSAFADRTVVAIAHRLNTILDFDRVVVMERGEIVEVGPPRTLLNTQGSMFRALVEAQGRGKRKD